MASGGLDDVSVGSLRRLSIGDEDDDDDSVSGSSVSSDVTVMSHWLVATSVRAFLSLVERAGESSQEPVSLMLRGGTIDSAHVEEIESILEYGSKVSEAGFSDCTASVELMEALVRVLKRNKVIQSLYLNSVDAGLRGADTMLHSLKHNKTLTCLRLSYMNFGDQGARLLAANLKRNHSLQTLRLESNGISDAGVKELVYGVILNRGLVHLDFCNEKITDLSALQFAEALGLNKRIIKFNLLECNAITPDGARAFLEYAQNSTRVIEIGLTSTQIPNNHSALKSINKIVSRNRAYAVHNYLKALESKSLVPWMRSKLTVVGAGQAGKTSTVRSLLGQKFDAKWTSTVGISTQETQCCTRGRWKALSESTTASHTDSLVSQIASEFLNGHGLPHLERSIHRKARTTPWRQAGRRRASKGPAAARLSLADGVKVAGIQQYGERLVRSVSGDESQSIRLALWDFGGQAVFHALNSLFLTQYGVYLLVFDMQKLVKSSVVSMEHIRFWLYSLLLHAPKAPTILVGTFLDSVDSVESLRTIISMIHQLDLDRFPQVITTGAKPFVSIDNRSGRGVSSLHQLIDHTVAQQDHVKLQVSIAWMQTLDSMLASDKTWCTLSSVVAQGEKHGITAKVEVEKMLLLFHELGVVFHFSTTEHLKELVILDPQWLVTCLSSVIHDYKIKDLDKTYLKTAGLDEDFQRFASQGIITRDLLEFFWGRTSTNFLLDLMQHLLLLSPWHYGQSDAAFLVPCMIKEAPRLRWRKTTVKGKKLDFIFQFLPDGVFEYLVCICVQISSVAGMEVNRKKKPVLGTKYCKLWLEGVCQVHMTREKSAIEVVVTKDEYAPRCLEILMSMVKKVNDQLLSSRLEWEVRLETSRGMLEHHRVQQERIEPWVPRRDRKYTASDHLDGFVGSM